MFTDQRLSEAYQNACVKYFDEHSKYIFFSDIHRGDDSISDEFARNQNILLHALSFYFNKGYTYVEVGDGDELWEYSEFKLIRLSHNDIFMAIKKFYDANRYILLYGNHNIFLKKPSFVRKNYYFYNDEYTSRHKELFNGINPHEALLLKNRVTKQEVFVVHGHQGDLMNDQLWKLSMFTLRYFWRYLHVVGFHNPASPARNQYTRHKVETSYKKWIRKHNTILICGHTHRPRFPKKGELSYFNTGCCIHSKGITGIEIAKNQIMLVEWRIRAEQDGNLHIERHILHGPEPLENFSNRVATKYTKKGRDLNNHVQDSD
jgi:UDP-2,3-diacylglucosamine pyrophosphatase LpxH